MCLVYLVSEPLEIGKWVIQNVGLRVTYLWCVDIQEQAVLVHAGHAVNGLSENVGGLVA